MNRFAQFAFGSIPRILVIAGALRAIVAVWWHVRSGGQFAFGDTDSYWVLGQQIARGQPYVYGDAHVFRMPGYPLLLAAVFRLVGSDHWGLIVARAVHVALGVGGVATVGLLGDQLGGRTVGRTSAAIAAVYPGLIAVSVLLLSEALFCLLVPLQLAFWLIAWRKEDRSIALLFALSSGAVAGLAALVRPSWLLFTPLALGLAWAIGPDRRRTVHLAPAMLLGLVVVMTPWWIRNARVAEQFVPTTLQVGASLYDGLNPAADGSSDMRRLDPIRRRVELEYAGQSPISKEIALDRAFRRAAFDWAKARPARVARLAVMKFVRMWNVWPNEPSLTSPLFGIPLLLGYVPVLFLAILTLVRGPSVRMPSVLCWLPAIYFTALHVVFVSSIRYRVPAMLGLIVLAAWRACGAKTADPSTSLEGKMPSER